MSEQAPHLKRELDLYDLTLMLVVAVTNVNVLPQMAAEGWRALTIWGLGFLFFLIPAGIAVVEFGQRYPGEGGIYLWTREIFGDFHAFISGWCYWTNNLFYIPSVLFILIGVLTYAGGAGTAELASNKNFMAITSISMLWFITVLHIRGLGAGKWLNNLGGLSIWISMLLLLAIALVVINRNDQPATPFTWSALFPSLSDKTWLWSFSLAIYSLVGLELGSVMGDEIKNVKANIRKAVFLGGTICIVLYLIGTASLLTAVDASDVIAIQGLMQAVTVAGVALDLQMLIPPIALVMGVAVMGICSAWLAGSARIPFVMGIEAYLPKGLGKTHPRWNSPYVALLVQGVVSTIFILISLYGAKVNEAYNILLSSSIIIQLIPFLYLFLGLYKLGQRRIFAAFGVIATAFGIIFVFIPSNTVENVLAYELKVIFSSCVMLGLAYAFYRKGKGTTKAQSH